MSENPRLTVIDGSKGRADSCSGECKSEATERTTVDAEWSGDQDAQSTYDSQLKQLLISKLAHEHRTQMARLEEGMRILQFTQTLERITFEASISGVPVRHIEESHSTAFEAIEAAQARVS